jgi:DNA-binding transcriptional ArsR family regulator
VNTPQKDPLLATLRALAEPMRLRILELLATPAGPRRGPVGESEPGLCLSDLRTRLGRPHALVCHHVGVLQRVGLVVRVKRGRWAVLRVDRRCLAVIGRAIGALGDSSDATPVDESVAQQISDWGTRPAA